MPPVLDTASVRLTADNRDFDQQWSESIKQIAKMAAVAAAATAAAIGIGKALRDPAAAAAAFAGVVGTARAGLTAFRAEAVTAFQAIRAGAPIFATLSTALARVGRDMTATWQQLKPASVAFRELGKEFQTVTVSSAEVETALGRTGAAVAAAGASATKAAKGFSFWREILAGVFLQSLASISGFIARKLNPDLSALATNFGRLTEAEDKLQDLQRQLATAFEEGRQQSQALGDMLLAALIPTIGRTGEGVTQTAGFVAGLGSMIASIISVGARWALNITLIGGALQILNGILKNKFFGFFIEELGILNFSALNATKRLTALAAVAGSQVWSSFKALGTTFRILSTGLIALAVAHPGVTLLVAALGFLAAGFAAARSHADAFARDMIALDTIGKDSGDVFNALIAKLKFFSQSEQQVILDNAALARSFHQIEVASKLNIAGFAGEGAMVARIHARERERTLADQIAQIDLAAEKARDRANATLLATIDQQQKKDRLIAEDAKRIGDLIQGQQDDLAAITTELDRQQRIYAAIAQTEQTHLGGLRDQLGIEQQLTHALEVQGASRDVITKRLKEAAAKQLELEGLQRQAAVNDAEKAEVAANTRLAKLKDQLAEAQVNLERTEKEIRDRPPPVGPEERQSQEAQSLFLEGLRKQVEEQQAATQEVARTTGEARKGLKTFQDTRDVVGEGTQAEIDFGKAMKDVQEKATQQLANLRASSAELQGQAALIERQKEDYERRTAAGTRTVEQEAKLRDYELQLADLQTKQLQNQAGQIAAQRTINQEVLHQGTLGRATAEQVAAATASMTELAGQAAEVAKQIQAQYKGGLTVAQVFSIELVRSQERLDLAQQQAQADQAALQAQADALNVQKQSLEILDQSTDRDRAIIRLDQDRLLIQAKILLSQRATAEAKLAELEGQLKLAHALEDETQRLETERKLTAQIDAQKAQIEGLDVAIKGTVVSAAALEKQFNQVGKTILHLGDLFGDVIGQALEHFRTGAGSMKAIIKGIGDTIFQSLEQGFAKGLAEKLKFDLEFKNNFLTELPAIAQQGANLIGAIFTGKFGEVGSGFQGLLGALGQVVGVTNQIGLTAGIGGQQGGSGQGNLSNLLSIGGTIGQHFGQATGFIGKLFGAGVGAGTTTAGGIVPAGIEVVGPETPIAGEELATLFPNFVGPTTAEFGPTAATSVAAGGGGALGALGTAGISAGVISALQTLAAAFSAQSARLGFFGEQDQMKFVAKQFSDPITSAIGELATRITSFGVFGAREGFGGVQDLVLHGKLTAAGIAGVIANPLAPLIALLGRPPSQGTAARKALEDFTEGPKQGVPFFEASSGTFNRSIGQREAQAFVDTAEGRAIAAAGGDAFQVGLDRLIEKQRISIGLTKEQRQLTEGFIITFDTLLAKEHRDAFSVALHKLGGVAALLGNIEQKGLDATDTMAILDKEFANLGPPNEVVQQLNAAFQKGLLTAEDYRTALVSIAKVALRDVPAGVDVGAQALRILDAQIAKSGASATVSFNQITAAVGDAANAVKVLDPALRQAFEGGVSGAVPAVLKSGIFTSLRDGLKTLIMTGIEDAFVAATLKSTPLEGFFGRIRETFRQLAGGDIGLTEALAQVKDEGAGALASLEQFAPVLDLAIAAGQQMATVLGGIGAAAKATVGDLTRAFSASLTQGFGEALTGGLNAALQATTLADGMRTLATTLGDFVRGSVVGALIQAFTQSSAFQAVLAPLQGVLATAMAEAVAGGITAGTLASVQSAVAITAQALKQTLAAVAPLFAEIFGAFQATGNVFGLPGAQQAAQTQASQDRITALNKEAQLVQEAARTRLDALQKEITLAQRFRDLQTGAQATIEDIQKSNLGGLTPFGQVELTRSRIDTALGQFRDTKATSDQRLEAGQRLLELLPLLLQQGSAAYQPASNDFAQLREFVLATLAEVRAAGVAGSKSLESLQAESLKVQQSSDATLKNIEAQVTALNEALQRAQRTGGGTGVITPGAAGNVPPPPGSPFFMSAEGRSAVQASLKGDQGAVVRPVLEQLAGIKSFADVGTLPIQNWKFTPLQALNIIQSLFPNLGTDFGAFKQIVAAMLAKLSGDASFSPILGYEKGGVVPGRIGAPQVAIVHGGEQIRPYVRGGWDGAAAGMYVEFAPETHITIHVPPGTKVNAEELANRTAALVEQRLERSIRVGGRTRQVLRAAFPVLGR